MLHPIAAVHIARPPPPPPPPPPAVVAPALLQQLSRSGPPQQALNGPTTGGGQRSSKTDACHRIPSVAPVTCQRTMQRLWRLQSRKNKAVRFLHAAEQAQRQPPETGHRTARPSPSTALHGTAAAAAAVIFCCLCIISTAAAQPGQCPAAWTTAALSVALSALAATSLPEQGLAIFAGGDIAGL